MGCRHSVQTLAFKSRMTKRTTTSSSPSVAVPQDFDESDDNNEEKQPRHAVDNNPDEPTCSSSALRGRVSACSYRSYLSYDELAPASLFSDRLSLMSGFAALGASGPDVALVTPHGTVYRMSTRTGGKGKKDGGGGGGEGGESASRRHAREPSDDNSVFVDELSPTIRCESGLSTVFDYASFCFDRQHPDRIALLDGATGQYLTFAEMTSLSKRFASGLYAAGLKPRDRLLVVCSTVLEMAPLFLGVAICGAQITMLSSSSTVDEILQRLRRLTVSFVVMDVTAAMCVRKAARRYGKLKKIYSVGSLTWCDQLSSLADNDGVAFPRPDVTLATNDEVILLAPSRDIFDSAHMAQLTHGNLIACWKQLRRPEALRLTSSSDVVLGLVPFTEVFGLVVGLFSSLLQGCCVVCVPGFETRHMLSAMDRHKVNVIHLLPTWVGSVTNHPLFKTHPDRSAITMVVYGTPNVPFKHKRYMRNFGFRDVIYLHGYVETASIVAITNCDEQCSDDIVGLPLHGTQFKVVDRATGRTVGHHEDGDIYVRGPQVMKLGYLGQSDERHPLVLDGDGWLRTGDSGWMDADGNLFISPRPDSIIKFRKCQISAREIETVIMRHPGVADVMVYGISDPTSNGFGQVSRALVVLKPGYVDVTAAMLLDFTNKHLATQKQLRGGLDIVDSIKRSSNGRALRRLWSSEKQPPSKDC